MSSIQLRKAERKQAKLRIGLSGPSGSGKTYSALLIARGIVGAENMDKVAVIDTENGSAELYADLGSYNVVRLSNPYTPERYLEAIKACEDSGMEILIIDSVSHEWDGKGVCLEINELLGKTKYKGNSWAAWNETTPRHQRFIESITTSKIHVITTARSKTDTIQTEDKKIKKVGLKEIQREGFEYELTLNFNVDREGHYATASKDRTSMFDKLDPFLISEETGKQLIAWANKGVVDTSREDAEKEKKEIEDKKAQQVVLAKKKKIQETVKSLGIVLTAENANEEVRKLTQMDLVDINLDEIINRLNVLVKERSETKPE
jgi:hypothetical protein